MEIAQTLEQRGTRYGSYSEQSQTAQNIKDAFENSPNWHTLPAPHKEALQMIATKAARILHGDPNYIDSWHDICGYSQLVVDALEQNK